MVKYIDAHIDTNLRVIANAENSFLFVSDLKIVDDLDSEPYLNIKDKENLIKEMEAFGLVKPFKEGYIITTKGERIHLSGGWLNHLVKEKRLKN